jgi:nicotinamide riboside kinase|tara:strand:- start:9752 stop:10270 length:519 start_codon:yes stop_codon:yes gene_type:complete
MINRIALVGASSTGKTTVYELLKNRFPKYEFVNESTRTVKKYGFPINEQGTSETQLAISSFHLEALLKPYNSILDRCYLDLVVYSSLMPNCSEEAFKYINATWERIKDEYTHYIYFPIEFDSVDDGVRSIDEEWRQDVDKEFFDNLEQINKPYLTVTGSPMQRVEQILNFIK